MIYIILIIHAVVLILSLNFKAALEDLPLRH